jgi:thiol-disulfide isomerase/thioredoxin
MSLLVAALIFNITITGSLEDKHPSAAQVLRDATSIAKRDRKQVFLIFGATWCKPCKQAESLIRSNAVLPILNKYFVVSKLFTLPHSKADAYNAGSEDLLKKITGTTMLPSYAILDDNGKVRTFFEYTYPGGQSIRLGIPEGELMIGNLMRCFYDANPQMSEEDLLALRKAMLSRGQ